MLCGCDSETHNQNVDVFFIATSEVHVRMALSVSTCKRIANRRYEVHVQATVSIL
jgi:hypothetical protein